MASKDLKLRSMELVDACHMIRDLSFLIEVECQDDHKKHLYRVSFDLSQVTRLYDLDTNLLAGELKLHVYVGSLKALHLCVLTRDSDSDDSYLDDSRSSVKKVDLELN